MMEPQNEPQLPPVSPNGLYFNSSAVSLVILAVLETEQPIKIPPHQLVSLLDTHLLSLHPRFSSVIVTGRDGEKRWKRVGVNLKDHIKTAVFPQGKSPEYYEGCFNDYLSEISAEQLPVTRPLWEIHLVKYPTPNAAGNVIFKIHHAIGDGYSLMAALLSCFKRSDDPSLPLTLPSHRIRKLSSSSDDGNVGAGKRAAVSRVLAAVLSTASDLWLNFSKTRFLEDDLSPIRSGDPTIGLRPISAATVTFSLDEIKQIKSQLGMTVNDVITGAVFLGTRLYMHGVDPGSDGADTTALVLLNTRMLRSYNSIEEMVKQETNSPWGNHFSFLHVTIPKLTTSTAATSNDSDDALEFVRAASAIIQKKRHSLAVPLTAKLLHLYRKLKGSEAAAGYVYRVMKSTSMLITNMIGPVEKMSMADHHIKGIYFLVSGNPQNVQTTIVSYMGELRVSVAAEKGFIDPNTFKSCVETAFRLIRKSACTASH
ncbi:unnamed protein product [Linum tenue]|uniref:Diacylglycerol O-acyltransferase n=1 Tax=Linum tenue TaxID=586396 RepID=A0AAV0MSU8_9ROSI|nr:unnamed protein product [Linum tenue]